MSHYYILKLTPELYHYIRSKGERKYGKNKSTNHLIYLLISER